MPDVQTSNINPLYDAHLLSSIFPVLDFWPPPPPFIFLPLSPSLAATIGPIAYSSHSPRPPSLKGRIQGGGRRPPLNFQNLKGRALSVSFTTSIEKETKELRKKDKEECRFWSYEPRKPTLLPSNLY